MIGVLLVLLITGIVGAICGVKIMGDDELD